MPSTEHVVLGAGPAGLGAAWWLARAGRSVTVLERAGAVGGLAGSFEVAGVRVDHGSHRLHPACPPAILADLRDLLGDDLQLRRRNGRLRIAGRWVRYPPAVGDLLRHLPVSVSARAAYDALTGPRRRPAADTFAEVVRARLGPTLADGFYVPYARKLFGRDPAELDGELARVRVTAGSPLAVVARAWRSRRGVGGAGTFWYPRRGYGQISERLADAAAAAGARVELGTEVTEVAPGEGGVRVATASGAVLDGGQVWSTIPLPALVGRLRPGPPAGVAEATARLASRGLLLVYLVVARAPWTPYDAHYLADPACAAVRVSEPRNYRDDPGAPADRTVLCAEVPADPGDVLWEADDDELGGRVRDDLARAGLPAVGDGPVVVRRVPRAYPVYTVGFAADLAAVESWVGARPRLLVFGRQGLHAHDNTHHALAMARAAVDAVDADGTVDPRRWASAREGFRSHVVED